MLIPSGIEAAMEANELEPITGDNWHDAASALCRAAMFYETSLVRCLEKHPALIKELIVPHLEAVDHCKAIVQHWRNYLEIITD
jgi:hypothetical protein